jgi:hypothetical protein
VSAAGARGRRSKAPSRPLWTCPECRRPFANRNQQHSCQIHTVAEHLADRPAEVVALYKAFAAMVRRCGPVTVTAAKTRIAFQARMIFSAVSLTNSALRAQVVLARRLEHPRFHKVESFSPRNHLHQFVITARAQLDETVQAWLDEAYKVGRQEHLSRPAGEGRS